MIPKYQEIFKLTLERIVYLRSKITLFLFCEVYKPKWFNKKNFIK
jgi:hypothetical protein